MSTITQLRRELVELLEAAGVPTVDHVPEELPGGLVAVIDGDDDYLELADNYSRDGAEVEVWLRVTVYLLVDLAANAQATEDLDQALGKVLPPLSVTAWEVGRVPRPGPFHTTQWLAHGVAIPLANLITLTTS